MEWNNSFPFQAPGTDFRIHILFPCSAGRNITVIFYFLMHWYFIKSGPKPRAPLTCPGSAASSLHAPFPTWKTPPSPPSQALPLLTDSTKLNCTEHTSENLINIVWKYNWGLTGAWIFHFEAKISALIYEKDLVLQIAMTVEINVNPSYAFPLNLQSLSQQCCVSPGHTSPGRAAETPRYSQPCSSQAQHRLQKGSETSNTFGVQNPAEGLSYTSRLSLGLPLDQVLCQHGSWHISWWLGHEYLRAKCSPKLFYNTRTHLPLQLFCFQSLQKNLYQFVPNSSAITEALGDNGKGLSGFNLKLCILIS